MISNAETPVITLIGPPNSGKTTIFNILSGKNFKTVNYPGSTVEYYTSRILAKYNIHAELLDSPGLISLIPDSLDEQVTINSLYHHPRLGTPQLLIATVDASQLSRHLLLPVQLLKSGFNVIIALTMNDLLQKRNIYVSIEKLKEELGCSIIQINGRTKEGIGRLIKEMNSNLEDIR
ncbi:MAG: ferrous iron transporter B, partial [Ignavibacteriaceae bacterium]|nr:ferrous iron transporter B [Ignavibacteriaceae bacterium]